MAGNREKYKSSKQNFNRCCNPFDLTDHNKTTSLRKVSAAAVDLFVKLREDDLVCSSCRKDLKVSVENIDSTSMEVCKQTKSFPEEKDNYELSAQLLADFLLSESPSDNINLLPPQVIVHSIVFFNSIISMINNGCCSKIQILQLLTLFAQVMSVSEIKSYLNVSKYSIKQAKELVQEKGILAMPDPKRGKKLPEKVVDFVLKFYERDDISSARPGTREISVMKDKDGNRIEVPKRLLLWNLLEAYELLKEDLLLAKLNCHIGLTKFTLLRPKNILLVGATGTHNVCVCSIHQNIKLLISGSHMAALTTGEKVTIETYKDCYQFLLCKNPSENCYFLNCKKCPGKEGLNDYLMKVLEKNEVSKVFVKQWMNDSNNKTVLETLVLDHDEFVSLFLDKFDTLLGHAFIAEQQSKFSREIVFTLKEGEFQIIVDFAENYSFVIQDAIPGFHWNNDQATIYNVVIYYVKNGKVYHKSLVIISDNRKHDAIAVYTFHQIVIEYLKKEFGCVNKIFYFSDGAPQQYKNYRNIINLAYHKQDFGIDAEWHFYPTAHGKGPCDGLGASVKRGAKNASLQSHHIVTCEDLFNWCNTTSRFPLVTFRYSSSNDYNNNVKFLKKRLEGNSNRIDHLQEKHCLIPLGDGSIRVKRYSTSNFYTDEPII